MIKRQKCKNWSGELIGASTTNEMLLLGFFTDNKITEFDMINTKNSSTAYVVIYKLIT